ncbi:hypothetical protein K461DRAFT_285583 [Myriangium duriaei CBS 260.36]|uniref:M protein repeat protein n=1 Tax=Myriangium duriaei CBS 260.36 TaxID=1168546 RepID=A0A9P4J5W9_9PEZI|nr:hypothetical protein K461DRAFT_285583 [Myriangium duriaei CBS 260.36]
MADTEDKEKAEKLAAAKKRFEQLKKQKQGGKKGGTKKKEEKTEEVAVDKPESAEAKDTTTEPDAEADVKPDEAGDEAPKDEEDSKVDDAAAEADDAESSIPKRTPSLTAQSRQRSESFRKGAGGLKSPALKSPTLPTVDSEGEVQEVYRKQAARIEELEKQVEATAKAQEKLDKAEEELERLRENSGDVMALKAKALLADDRATEIEKLKTELSSTQRQLTQAQQSAASKNRRTSTASPSHELTEQLASKTSTIESLELELSNLRYQISSMESDKSGLDSKLRELEARVTTADQTSKTLQDENRKLKDSLTAPMSESDKSSSDDDSAALRGKISVLESELRTSQAAADAAQNKASNLETKVDTLTKLHRESSTQNATREKEVKDLKARIKSINTVRSDAAGEDLSDLEDEEREKLHARIRDLEAETFELRRGVWRDKRAALQPGMHDEAMVSPGSANYEDVDLNGYGATPYNARQSFGAGARQTSTFSDVLQSGISAFTGRDNSRAQRSGSNDGPSQSGQRKASLDLLSEEGFDEDAFRVAQEEEAKARIERIREVKRGLEQWRGWKLDLVDQRQGGVPGFATGPIFDV